MIPLSLKKFALAVGAHPKWVLNARLRLCRPLQYTPSDAQWLRLTRVLNREVRIPLRFASTLAASAIEQSRQASKRATTRRVVCVVTAKADGVRLTVDFRRQDRMFAAALAQAIDSGEGKRPGRKRRPPAHDRAAIGRAWRLRINVGLLRFRARKAAAAAHRGADFSTQIELSDRNARTALLQRLVDHRVRFVVVGELAETLAGALHPMTGDPGAGRPILDVCYAPSRANIRRVAVALRGLGDVVQGAPTAVDPVTLRGTTALPLATSVGVIRLRSEVAGIGGFDEVRRRSTRVRAFDLELAVLDLPALAQVRAASGKRDDVAHLPMLQTLLALPALEERHREVHQSIHRHSCPKTLQLPHSPSSGSIRALPPP